MYAVLVIAGLTVVLSAFFILTDIQPTWMYFNAYAVRNCRQWHRLITYAFVHVGWKHLIFNMYWVLGLGMCLTDRADYEGNIGHELFGGENGTLNFVIYYIGAVIFSTLGDLLIHKDNPYFNAVGASGVAAALIFTLVLLDPTAPVPIIFFSMKAWICAIFYLLYCILMAIAQVDNIGHTSHLCGAIYGFVVPCIYRPHYFVDFFAKIFGLN